MPPKVRRMSLLLAQALMLWATWLLLTGTLTQAEINWTSAAPVTGLSMAIFYASGIVFAVSAIGLLLRDMWRIASGQTTDDELLLVSESEELEAAQPHGKQPH